MSITGAKSRFRASSDSIILWGSMMLHRGAGVSLGEVSLAGPHIQHHCLHGYSSATLVQRHAREFLPPTSYQGFLYWVFMISRSDSKSAVPCIERLFQVRGSQPCEEVFPLASGQCITIGFLANNYSTSSRTNPLAAQRWRAGW